VLTSPNQYKIFLVKLKESNGNIPAEYKQQLALEAFEHTATYDVAISHWMQNTLSLNSNTWLEAIPIKQTLRYGENPHQKSKWYSSIKAGWGQAKQLQGKELSTNNLLDLEASLCTVSEFSYGEEGIGQREKYAAVVVKHTNPCGVALGDSLETALLDAIQADKTSAFGGIVALNNIVDRSTAIHLSSLFLECVVAPGFNQEAKDILSKKTNLRLLELNPDCVISKRTNFRSILGGVLVQDQDNSLINETAWETVSQKVPTKAELEDLKFAWKVARHVHSNAIVVASCCKTLGIGAGQMNRVGAAKLALDASEKNSNTKTKVLASDGFFPFDDTVRLASKYNVQSIIQPGGSIRDQDSINVCNDLNIAMVFTHQRHFLH